MKDKLSIEKFDEVGRRIHEASTSEPVEHEAAKPQQDDTEHENRPPANEGVESHAHCEDDSRGNNQPASDVAPVRPPNDVPERTLGSGPHLQARLSDRYGPLRGADPQRVGERRLGATSPHRSSSYLLRDRHRNRQCAAHGWRANPVLQTSP